MALKEIIEYAVTIAVVAWLIVILSVYRNRKRKREENISMEDDKEM